MKQRESASSNVRSTAPSASLSDATVLQLPKPTAIPPPLRLPVGSVRAVLALIVCGTLWYATLQGTTAPSILIDSALLVVAFYFGVRSTAPVVPVQMASVTAKQRKVRQPLFLPHGSVRTVLALGFLGVMGYVAVRDHAIPQTLPRERQMSRLSSWSRRAAALSPSPSRASARSLSAIP